MKVTDHLGKNKEQKIIDELAVDKVRESSGRDLVIFEDNKVLFLESHTGRYFMSTVESVRQAQNTLNARLVHDGYASLTDFYNLIGLNQTEYSEEVGWKSDKLLEVIFSAVMTENDKPCIVITYSTTPIRNYHKAW